MDQQAPGQGGILALIGMVALAMAGTIVYFSALPTLVCTRGSEYVECAVTARVLDLVDLGRGTRVAGVRSVALIQSSTDGNPTPPRLIFQGPRSSHDLGYFSQPFASEWRTLDAFARNPTTPELRLAAPVTRRRVIAHFAAAVLLCIGGLALVTAVLRG